MNTRFNELTVKEVSLLRRMEYEELKYRLLAFLVVAEAKLKTVQVKYGKQEEVNAMLQDYIVSEISYPRVIQVFFGICFYCWLVFMKY